ncbi:MAG TPA: resistance to Congo red protein [Chloroflexota bacterium]|nr:resistance to Congo red protein [Chloroflexota bacterium]
MSTVPLAGILLGLGLGGGALIVTQGLLAYVARREPGEAAALLPFRGAAALVVAVFAAVLLLLWNRQLTVVAGVQAGWTAALAVIFTVDLRVRYILDVWTAPLALLAILAAILLPHPPYPALLAVLGGGAIGCILFAAFYGLGLLLFRQPALGLGDVKLAVLLGLILGAGDVLTAIFIGAFLGGLASLALVALRRAKLGDAPAYGTYLALGGYAALLEAAGLWH